MTMPASHGFTELDSDGYPASRQARFSMLTLATRRHSCGVLRRCYACHSMAHPLATQLAPLMSHDLHELRSIVAHWVVNEPSETERFRYRRFGAELRAVKDRIAARPAPPSEEELEIALTALLVLSGRRGCG